MHMFPTGRRWIETNTIDKTLKILQVNKNLKNSDKFFLDVTYQNVFHNYGQSKIVN